MRMELTKQAQRRRGIRMAVCTVATLVALHLLPALTKTPDIAENRELAGWPSRPRTLPDALEWPKRADAWIQDHFPARVHLIAWLNLARYKLGDSGSSRVIVGREGWLFYDDGSHLGAARAAQPLTDAETLRWVTTLAARTESLRRRGIPYVVLVPPVKERVYPDYAPVWFHDGGANVDAERLRAAADASGYGNVLYVLPQMLAARREAPPAYTPQDIHWTGNGAYRAYLELALALRRAGVPIDAWPLSRYSPRPVSPNPPRDVSLMLGVGSFVPHVFPQFEFPGQQARLQVDYLTGRRDWTGPRVITTGAAGKPVLLMTGDSFSNELLPFLYPHFSRLVLAHDQDGFHREDLIQRFHPDVVVMEVVESGVRHAMAPPMDPPAEIAAALRSGRAAAAIVPPATPVASATPLLRRETPTRIAALLDASQARSCNLEVAEPSRATSGARSLRVEGWMFDLDGARAADATTLLLVAADGSGWSAEVANHVARPDVAAHFGLAHAKRSGFSSDVVLAPALAGTWEAVLVQRFGPSRVVCRRGYSVKLSPKLDVHAL